MVAQRELHAQIRPTASSWSALGGAELTPIDGKIALGSGILPFEMFLRLGLGASASSEAVRSTPTFAFAAGLGARWFLTGRFGLDTSFTWRSASITRQINGVATDLRDTIVAFDVGDAVPDWRGANDRRAPAGGGLDRHANGLHDAAGAASGHARRGAAVAAHRAGAVGHGAVGGVAVGLFGHCRSV